MAESIDVELFISQLADDERVAAELRELAILPSTLADIRRDAREHTIDALIQAVAGAPAATIRETLGTVLAESLAAEDATIRPLELEQQLTQLEQRLRDLDQ